MSLHIYHNPRCSKSRQTLELLQENGHTPEIVEYLKTPPTAQELEAVLKKLGKGPREVMRKGEAVFKELSLGDDSLTDAQLIDAMVANPILIERPIVITTIKAAIGRPPESVLDIL
ncbi:MAG: arsenate reductase (glutaredoxin) [Alphaproteobacteria bacterium]|uniref:arsenate reductase (glutaredoxin) n=1 Tax=Pyruvatibacter sp. HU-CL02332 TaxID=3127650 RepID=UPI0029687980|nr:arsenate reductase (glutaredoxin) [Alphaproteobacteria bacterium]